jgi:hypothetical protein
MNSTGLTRKYSKPQIHRPVINPIWLAQEKILALLTSAPKTLDWVFSVMDASRARRRPPAARDPPRATASSPTTRLRKRRFYAAFGRNRLLPLNLFL